MLWGLVLVWEAQEKKSFCVGGLMSSWWWDCEVVMQAWVEGVTWGMSLKGTQRPGLSLLPPSHHAVSGIIAYTRHDIRHQLRHSVIGTELPRAHSSKTEAQANLLSFNQFISGIFSSCGNWKLIYTLQCEQTTRCRDHSPVSHVPVTVYTTLSLPSALSSYNDGVEQNSLPSQVSTAPEEQEMGKAQCALLT